MIFIQKTITVRNYLAYLYIVYLTKKEESAQKVWSKDLVHEKTFQLLNRTPHI